MPSSSSTAIRHAAKLLQRGDLVVMPTETVYGLAADAFNTRAIKKIFALKKHPLFDPLIVHIHSKVQLNLLARNIPLTAKKLMDQFWPGPLTLVLHAKSTVPQLVTGGLPTVAIRMPQHPVAQKLLKAFNRPLAAPSANRFGRISPTSTQAVKKEFGKKTPYILEGGSCQFGLESTVIHFLKNKKNKPEILRLGSITPEQIENTLKKKVSIRKKTVLKHPLAPGQLASHYAPQTSLELLPTDWRKKSLPFSNNDALLLFHKPFTAFSGTQYLLSQRNSLKEAAKNLYQLLRLLDEKKFKKIYAELVPNRGLGIAINDRLKKAAHP